MGRLQPRGRLRAAADSPVRPAGSCNNVIDNAEEHSSSKLCRFRRRAENQFDPLRSAIKPGLFSSLDPSSSSSSPLNLIRAPSNPQALRFTPTYKHNSHTSQSHFYSTLTYHHQDALHEGFRCLCRSFLRQRHGCPEQSPLQNHS
jgi:hypothetical protein